MKLFANNSIPTKLDYDRFDILRDGGSLAVSFFDQQGNQCELMFPVSAKSIDTDIKTYKKPIFTKWLKTIYVSKVTGIESSDFKKAEIEISWSKAHQLITRNVSDKQARCSDYPWVYETMITICKNDGKLVEKNT